MRVVMLLSTLGNLGLLFYLTTQQVGISWSPSANAETEAPSGPRSQDLCVKVNVNCVSGSKAYGFKHHKDFMFCSAFFLCIFMKILQHPEVLRFSFLVQSITGLLGKPLYAQMSHTDVFVFLYVMSMCVYIFV